MAGAFHSVVSNGTKVALMQPGAGVAMAESKVTRCVTATSITFSAGE